MGPLKPAYTYTAVVTECYDGDTITVDFDLGLHVWLTDVKLRLYGINTPELRGEEREAGIAARDYLRTRIRGKRVIIETIKDKTGKYGRYLAKVWFLGANINQELIDEGHADKY